MGTELHNTEYVGKSFAGTNSAVYVSKNDLEILTFKLPPMASIVTPSCEQTSILKARDVYVTKTDLQILCASAKKFRDDHSKSGTELHNTEYVGKSFAGTNSAVYVSKNDLEILTFKLPPMASIVTPSCEQTSILKARDVYVTKTDLQILCASAKKFRDDHSKSDSKSPSATQKRIDCCGKSYTFGSKFFKHLLIVHDVGINTSGYKFCKICDEKVKIDHLMLHYEIKHNNQGHFSYWKVSVGEKLFGARLEKFIKLRKMM